MTDQSHLIICAARLARLVRQLCVLPRPVLSLSKGLLAFVGGSLLCLAPLRAGAAAPTLVDIPDQTVIQDHPTDGLLLVIHDPDTPLTSLQLSGTSSNPGLVAAENIFFGIAGGNWYLTVTPDFGETGTATITVTVSDGTASVSDTLVVTVTLPPPGSARFSNPAPISIPQAGAAAPYPSQITVSQMPGAVTQLIVTLSRFSHERVSDVDMLLVGPTGQGVVIFSGISGGNRSATNVTVSLTDAGLFPLPQDFALWSEPLRPADFSGGDFFPGAPPGPYGAVALSTFNGLPASGTWSLYVHDAQGLHQGEIAGGWSLWIATNAISSKPTISAIPDQFIVRNSATDALAFTVGDPFTPVGDLTVTGNSSNPSLVPVSNIVLGGSGANRTVTVTPVLGEIGASRVTLTVDNGVNTASSSFILTVTEPVQGLLFTNAAAVTIPGFGPATPYPSTISVTDVTGVISRVTVTLNTLRHTYPADVDILLVGPTGHKVILFSDAGGGDDVFPVTVTLSDEAPAALPLGAQIISGIYKPTDYEPGELGELDSFPGAPDGPYSPSLGVFKGRSPNGNWSLYAVDDGPGDEGSLDAGWSLAVITAQPLTLNSVQMLTDGRVRITGTGAVGVNYTVQVSSDLIAWQSISTITPEESGAFEFDDAETEGYEFRFYRVISSESP